MIRKTQLKELVGHIVRGVLSEIGSEDLATSSSPLAVDTASPEASLSPVMQAKLEREKKLSARNKLKIDQQMLKKVDNDLKAQKSTYDLTRRQTRPNLKKQIDAQKKAVRSL